MKAFILPAKIFATRSGPPLAFAYAVRWLQPDAPLRWMGAVLLCFVASGGGVLLGRTQAEADILWPANGILLAFLLRRDRKFWPSYLAGGALASIAVHGLFHFPLPHSLMFAAANTVEVLLAASLLADESGNRHYLRNLRSLGMFVACGVLLGPLASTMTIGLLRVAEGSPCSMLELINWFNGDAIGIAIMTPFMLAIEPKELSQLFLSKRRWQTIILFCGVVILSWIVFSHADLPFVFVLFPPLLLAIFRLGSSGAAITAFLMAVPAAYYTAQHRGPFAAANSLIDSIFMLQCFFCVTLVMLYSVSAALSERDRLQLELTVAYREADASAATDHVTGIANRRTFDREFEREWRRAMREKVQLSLLMIDVDFFKLYNDHYGHVAGDLCLRSVAQILANAPLRASDLAARYGGEEFVVMLPRAGKEGAAVIGELIRQGVGDAALPHIGNLSGIVTVSIGVATIKPVEGTDPKTLIQHADAALYDAKRAGRNQVYLWLEDGPVPHYSRHYAPKSEPE